MPSSPLHFSPCLSWKPLHHSSSKVYRVYDYLSSTVTKDLDKLSREEKANPVTLCPLNEGTRSTNTVQSCISSCCSLRWSLSDLTSTAATRNCPACPSR